MKGRMARCMNKRRDIHEWKKQWKFESEWKYENEWMKLWNLKVNENVKMNEWNCENE